MVNLPAPPVEFYGRQRELNRLLTFFPTQKVMIIAGLAGIGKTALALTFAAHLQKQAEYTDRIIWVNCQKGWTDVDLFAQILKCMGIQAKKSQDLNQTLEGSPEGIIRLIEKNSLILFIDDFHLVESENTRQFIRLAREFFLQGRMIITTRKRIALSPMDRVDLFERRLDGLEMEDCRKLIEKMLRFHDLEDISDERFKKIYFKVKGHPFSIKLFISLLVSGGYSLDSLLNTASEFEEEIERFLLDRVWEILEKDEQDVLKILSVPRIPVRSEDFPLISESACKKALRVMLDMYLVEFNKEGRIFLHDLLKDYARNRIEQDTLVEYHSCAAEYFTSKNPPEIIELKEAYYHYHESGQTKKAADVIVRIGEQFLLQGEETESFYHLVNDACDSCGGYRLQELIRIRINILCYWNRVKEAEELMGRLTVESDREYVKGRINLQKGLHSEALKCFFSVLKNPASELMKLEILNSIAICSYFLGDWKQAEQYYEKSLEVAEKSDYPLMKGRILSNYAVMLNREGNLYRAVEFYQEAESIYRHCRSQAQLSTVLYNKAVVFVSLMELGKARESLKESMELKELNRDSQGQMYHHNLLADISFMENDPEQALEHNRRALLLAEKFSDTRMKISVHVDFGKIYSRTGKLKEAEMSFNTAAQLVVSLDNPLLSAILDQEYAQYLIITNQRDKAFQKLEKVRNFALNTEHQELLVKSLFFLSMISSDNSGSDDRFHQEYLSRLAQVPSSVRDRLTFIFRWFEDIVFNTGSRQYLVQSSRDGRKLCESRELSSVRQAKDNYEIFIDFVEHELLIRGSRIHFFKKRTLVPLLAFLSIEPGKIYEFSILFESVWGRKYDPETDGVTLRVNISRLRALLGDKKGKEHFIRSSADIGGYYFNSRTDYCIILPGENLKDLSVSGEED